MISRDSTVFWLGLAIAIVGYLGAAKPPTDWGYSEWIQAAAFVLAWLSGKLHVSPLAGAPKDDTINPAHLRGD